MHINELCKIRHIAGENVVLIQGEEGADMTRIVSLNTTSLVLWEALKGREFDIRDVVNVLVARYEVDTATALKDAENWVRQLQNYRIIKA